LDAQIHAELLEDALDAVAEAVGPDAAQRVLDVGAGTGAATFRLADRYPSADVVALDADETMARRIDRRASRAGARVTALHRPVLEAGLEPGSMDLVWASSVVHEFVDPARELAVLWDLVRENGVLAIMEMDASPRVLPESYEQLESRLRLLAHADATPPAWTDRITDAGFEMVSRRTLASDQHLPAAGLGGAYARTELRRLALHAGGGLDADETAALSRILESDPGSGHLSQVHVRATRTLWIARRP
jgi:trans-aconitate methyltransferase